MSPRRAIVLAMVLASAGCASVWGFDDLVVGDAGGDASIDGAAHDGTSPDGTGVQDGPAADATGEHDASPIDATAHDAGQDGEGGPACTDDLSGIGAADFHVRFTITTTATVSSAVLNQRPACGTSTLWDVRLQPSGTLGAETDDGTAAGHVGVISTATVNDGAAHHVDVARLSGVLSITIDGVASGAAVDGDSLGSLPPLRVGTDVCDGTDSGGDGTEPLVGSVSDVCLVAGGGLTPVEGCVAYFVARSNNCPCVAVYHGCMQQVTDAGDCPSTLGTCQASCGWDGGNANDTFCYCIFSCLAATVGGTCLVPNQGYMTCDVSDCNAQNCPSSCEGGGPVTHSDGLGQGWEDCAPLGTYDQTEATAACTANGGPSCVVNTCLGAGQAICDVDPSAPGYCTCWGFSGSVAGHVNNTAACTDPSLATCGGSFTWQ